MFVIKAEFSDDFHTDLNEYKLCFVKENVAYFTTQDLEKQDGPNWNEANMMLSAGPPYLPPKTFRGFSGAYPKWGILKICFSTLSKIYYATEFNTSTCVRAINVDKSMSWLFCDNFKIYAGINPKEFLEFLLTNEKRVGNVFNKIKKFDIKVCNAELEHHKEKIKSYMSIKGD